MRRPVESGFFSHVVGNGRVMQVGPVNNGSYDVGGGWNAESYAAVELIESHSTEEEFMEDYRLYIELLRNLAEEAGIPVTLDTDDLAGIKTHEYCTNNQPNNNSDHVDPYPYLAKWGISRSQFKQDIENGLNVEPGWKQNDTGYWYVKEDGSYPKEEWEKIDGTWYYFDERGYSIASRWLKDDGKWYYLKENGAMAIGWVFVNGKWYYLDASGAMVTGWVQYKDKLYHLKEENGEMSSKELVKVEGGWYYVNEDGSRSDKPALTVLPDGLIVTTK